MAFQYRGNSEQKSISELRADFADKVIKVWLCIWPWAAGLCLHDPKSRITLLLLQQQKFRVQSS